MSAMTYYIDGVYKAATYAGTDDNFYVWGRDADIVFNTTTSGTTRMVITNGGNVGIGISGPTQKLTVGGSIRVTGGYYDSSNSVGSNGQVLASTGTGTTWINASGGTVNGSGTVNYLSKWTGTTLLGDSVIYDNGTNVGIGTTAPGEKLQVNGLIRVTNPTFAGVEYHNTNGTWELYVGTESGGSGARYNSASSKHTFYNNSSAVLSIVSSGNVGIGNTLPSQKLHVEGNLRVTGAYYDSSNGAGSSGQVLSSTGSGTSWITPFSGSGTTNYVAKWTSGTALGNSSIFDNGTNVGIGTATPSEKLSVSGNINVVASTGSKIGFNTTDAFAAYSTSVAHYGISYGWNTNPIALSGYFGVGVFTSGTERMRIDGSGFVGIGTTSPSRLLHVAGNAQVDGWIFQGGYYNGSVTLPYPGANYGNGRIYLRLCSSASGRIMTAKVRISSTWNWAPAFGSVEADISFYWDGSSLVYSYVNILSATGLAATNLTFGALAVEGGSISVPVYCTNSNPIYAYIQLSPDADPSQVSYSTWSSVAFPGQSNVYIQTNLGVGTPSPSYRLDISGVSRFQDQVRFKTDVWQISDSDARNRFYFAPGGRTYFGSGDGYEWRSSADSALAVITNAGNLGINETSPSQKLHVSGNVRVTGAYYDSANAAGTSGQILSSTGTGTAWISPGGGGGIITGSGTTNYVTKWTGTSSVGDSGIFDNGSVVSVGTATPYSGMSTRLYVGDPQNSSVINANQFISVGAAGGSTNQAGINFLIYNAAYGGRIYTDDSTVRGLAFDILEGGTFYNVINITRTTSPNVGIGTTAPQKPLEVISGVNDFVSVGVSQMSVGNWSGIHFGYREANSSYRKSAIVFERTDLTANDAQGKIHILNGPQGSGGSATLADAKLTIAENGNVGVGATSPTSKLTIIAGANSFEDGSNAIRIEYPGSPSNGEIGGGLVFAQRWFSGAPDSLVRTGGIYGVKTNTNGAYGGGLVFYTQPNNGDPMGERMRINSLGSVGINTTNPGYKLDVIGSVRSYGGLFSNGYHGDTYIENLLPAANNGAGTGDVQLRMWCSEPGVTWAWAGFGYNVKNDGASPYGFGRVNTSFGQAYMRFSTEGDLFFYNTNTSGTRVTTMTLTNAGNVGIGTTVPGAQLELAKTTTWGTLTNEVIYINNSGTGGDVNAPHNMGSITWRSGNVNTAAISAIRNTPASGNNVELRFTTSSAGVQGERMTITNIGNVGIGETAPSQKLHVSGNIRVTGAYYDSANSAGTSGQILSSTATGTAWIAAPSGGGVSGSGTTNYVPKWTSGSAIGNSAIYDNAGNIGIGTTAPNGRLQINQGTDLNVAINTVTNDATTVSRISSLNDAATASTPLVINANRLVFTTDTVEQMRITSGGNVGIGTTVPAYKLDVDGGSSVSVARFYNSSNTASIVWVGDTGNSEYSDLILQSNSGTGEIFKNGSGYSGWGGALALNIYNSNGAIAFHPNSTANAMFISTTGNVGIGTTAPQTPLHIAAAAAVAPVVRLQTTNSTTNGAIQWTNSANSQLVLIGSNYNVGDSGGNLEFVTGGSSTRMLITSGGNIGINTTSPSYRLDVFGGSITSRRAISAPRISSAGEYVYGITNSPTWNTNQGSYTNNNTTSADGNTTAGTYTLSTTSWDLYQTISVTSGVEYTIGVWVKLGTATNFCIVVNNTINWNTVGGKAFDSSDGLSTSKWTHISYTFTGPASGLINLHIGAHSESAVPQQTAGTVFLWNWEMSVYSSTWIGKVDDEIRLPGSSIWTSRGSVGIGTTSPGNYKLSVIGGQFGTLLKGGDLGTGSDVVRMIKSDDSVAMLVRGDGNVGIGTTSPGAKLHVIGNIGGGVGYNGGFYADTGAGNAIDTNWGFDFSKGGGDDYSTRVKFYPGAGSARKLGFYDARNNAWLGYFDGSVNSSLNFIFSSGGNVGINTTSPSTKLEVAGDTEVITIRTSYPANSSQRGAILWKDASNITGTIDTRYDGSTVDMHFGSLYSSGYNSTTRLVIKGNGNVGIGTTSPAYKLDVSGTIRATGDVIAYSDARVKENVETLDGALDKVMKMRGVSYNKIGEQEKKVGVIAQEILEVLPEVVSQDETGTYSVAYGNIVSVLIEAIKEQQKEIDELKSKLK
jgi:hypothetical protein